MVVVVVLVPTLVLEVTVVVVLGKVTDLCRLPMQRTELCASQDASGLIVNPGMAVETWPARQSLPKLSPSHVEISAWERSPRHDMITTEASSAFSVVIAATSMFRALQASALVAPLPSQVTTTKFEGKEGPHTLDPTATAKVPNAIIKSLVIFICKDRVPTSLFRLCPKQRLMFDPDQPLVQRRFTKIFLTDH